MPWRREWQPTQYSCLEDSMDRGTWWATVHGVAKSWPLLSNFHTRTQDSAPGPLLTLYPFLIQSHPLAVASLSAVDRQTPGSYFHKDLLFWAPDLCMYSAAYNLSPWIIPRCLPTQQTKSKIKNFPGKPVPSQWWVPLTIHVVSQTKNLNVILHSSFRLIFHIQVMAFWVILLLLYWLHAVSSVLPPCYHLCLYYHQDRKSVV